MQYESWSEIARSIATQAHRGQIDKGGNDYILHPQFVASQVNSDAEKAVAWLHDVIEDTDITLEDLERVFPPCITTAVNVITKRKGDDYGEYLRRVASNRIAYSVKLADMKNNMDISRIPDPSEADVIRCKKYKEKAEYLKKLREEVEQKKWLNWVV